MTGEYLPANTKVAKLKERGQIVTSNNNIDIDFDKKGKKVIVNYQNNNYDDTYIEVPLLNYYGYYAYDQNGNKLKIKNGYNNIIRITNIPKDSGKITVYYKGTSIQKYSIIISVISFIGLIIYIFRKKK